MKFTLCCWLIFSWIQCTAAWITSPTLHTTAWSATRAKSLYPNEFNIRAEATRTRRSAQSGNDDEPSCTNAVSDRARFAKRVSARNRQSAEAAFEAAKAAFESAMLEMVQVDQDEMEMKASLPVPTVAASAEVVGTSGWGKDLVDDVQTRFLPFYKDDWKSGLTPKSIPAIMFLYFACLLPAVAFGGIAAQVTQGSLGVIEYLVACGASGMVYALFSGQPMTIIGPTGLTLAFMTALFSFTSAMGLPFLPVYSWCGVWTSGMMVMLSLGGASNLIRFATQFTDDVFNALLAVNFIYEASRSLLRNFSVGGYNKSSAFLALNIALATYVCTKQTVKARQSRYFNEEIREVLSDFGPVLVIMVMSLASQLPAVSRMGIEFLQVPTKFMLANARQWLSPMLSVPLSIRLASAIPALLLTSLFFLDQNISSRVVNSPKHNMVKPPAYHQDLLVLGLITGVLSVLGLPWQCAATVQSLNHVRAMSTVDLVERADGSKEEVVREVCENRVTGFSIHALILASVGMLPVLKLIPMPVVSGIFLYLGRKVMSGNEFLSRIKELVADRTMLTPSSAVTRVGYKSAFKYTVVQAGMLALLWTLKSFKQTALFFPSVIGLLVVMRITVLPKLFSERELQELDSPVG